MIDVSIEKIIVLGTVSFLTSLLSAIGGGGGGFIMTPFYIFMGLPPQNAIATGKIGGLGTTLGSLNGLFSAKVHRWNIVIPVMLLAALAGILSPIAITHLDNDLYRKLIGILLIALIPIMVIKKIGVVQKVPTKIGKLIGGPILFLTLILQGIFSSGMGTLVVISLMSFFGLRALEANITKRFAQILLNGIIVISLLGSNLIIWKVALVVFATNYVGGHLGSKLAVKKGDQFIMQIFIVLMFFSALGLIFS